MGNEQAPYSCEDAIVYRLATPTTDHYFFMNDDEAKVVHLNTGDYGYTSCEDPEAGEVSNSCANRSGRVRRALVTLYSPLVSCQ